VIDLESEEVKRYVGDHSRESRKKIGAWRWRGLYEHRDVVLPLLKGDVLDIGGADGPVGCGKILDTQDVDILGRPVPYHDSLDITERFDTVFASHILEHFYHVDIHLARWSLLLKPGGHLILQVPSIYNFVYNHPIRNKNHYWIFTTTGHLQQGFKAGILPLDRFVGTFHDIEFLEYVEGCSILCIARIKEGLSH
jgi:SAM-dependent methyltransferase